MQHTAPQRATGYEAARSMVEGESGSIWFAPAKFVATLATAASGVPGGIFAPSLATGAGVGDLLAMLFPGEPRGPIVLLGMIAFFVGVVRAPLTGVVIVSEMTGAHGLILPLFIAAIVADGAGALVCRERLYHGLAQRLKQ
ncbi:MAG: chloride channel protein [Hyphomonadaceae bacterium]